jgi:hypothetical protein
MPERVDLLANQPQLRRVVRDRHHKLVVSHFNSRIRQYRFGASGGANLYQPS